MKFLNLTDEVAQMRRRDLLHTKHLSEFAIFCELQGWIKQELRGDTEVLRMKKEGVSHVLIVHTRSGHWDPSLNGFKQPQHLTTWGMSGVMANRFYQERRKVTA